MTQHTGILEFCGFQNIPLAVKMPFLSKRTQGSQAEYSGMYL